MGDLKQVLRQFKTHTACGVGGVNPRAWLCLQDAMMEALLDIIMSWEASPIGHRAVGIGHSSCPSQQGGGDPTNRTAGVHSQSLWQAEKALGRHMGAGNSLP